MNKATEYRKALKYVKKQAVKRSGEYYFTESGDDLIIGCCTTEGDWAVWETKIVRSDGGYEGE